MTVDGSFEALSTLRHSEKRCSEGQPLARPSEVRRIIAFRFNRGSSEAGEGTRCEL